APRMIVDLAVSFSGARLETGALAWSGSPAGLVALIEAWAADGAVQGFNLLPAAPAADLAVFAEQVAPALRARGLIAGARAGGDLRTRLGLARPANRFAEPVGA
ncbi:MAG: hypothetical protein P4M09_25940, partial [Devosia sp.]|nr:hypothetical protein [Devosia sp.]